MVVITRKDEGLIFRKSWISVLVVEYSELCRKPDGFQLRRHMHDNSILWNAINTCIVGWSKIKTSKVSMETVSQEIMIDPFHLDPQYAAIAQRAQSSINSD